MIDIVKNQKINADLQTLYTDNTQEFIASYKNHFNDKNITRLNEFGIIDEEQYDTDKGILFICKETNGWEDDEFASNVLFRTWMEGITRNGLSKEKDENGNHPHITQHPQMWYNIGRWVHLIISYINKEKYFIDDLLIEKSDAIKNVGKIAFTNINKARGKESSGSKFWSLAKEEIVGNIIKEEIRIINPSIIVCCGVFNTIKNHLGFSENRDEQGRIYFDMPHPGARRKNIIMLELLEKTLIENIK